MGNRQLSHYLSIGPSKNVNTLLYQKYDLTDKLKSGKNVLAAIVAPNPTAEGRTRSTFYCQLELFFENGEHISLLTDTNWEASVGPIRAISPQKGEIYDSRREIPGWDNTGFDNGTWKRVSILTSPSWQLLADDIQLSSFPSKQHNPKKISSLGEGKYLIDYGRNINGTFNIAAQGTINDSIRIQLLPKPPSGDQKMEERYPMFIFICRGNLASESWACMRKYSFRYLLVNNYTGVLKPEEFKVFE